MANKHVHRCSASLIVRETHIKTAVSYRLPPTRVASEVCGNSMSWCRCGAAGTLSPEGRNVNGAAPVENGMEVPQKAKTQNNHMTQHFLSWVHTLKNGRQALKEIPVHLYVPALFTKAKAREQPKCLSHHR